MKILLTGATGFVGKKLVSDLVLSGHRVVLLTRDSERTKKNLLLPCDVFSWDPLAGSPPQEAFAGVEAVINLMGEGIAEKRWSAAQKKKIFESRVIGTRNLISGIEKFSVKSLSAFVSASAIGYYGSRGDEILNENSQSGQGFLADVCSAWEEETKKITKTKRTVNVRIGIVLGDGGGALSKMLPIFKLGAGGPVGSGKQVMSWIHLNDLVKILIQSLSDERISGPVNAVSPNPVSNSQFSKTLGYILGKPAFMPAPAFALKLAMGELSSIVLDSQRVYPEKLKSIGFNFDFPDLAAALSDVCHVRQHYKNKKKVICDRFLSLQWLPKNQSEVASFFSDAKILEKLTPPNLHLEIATPDSTKVELGSSMALKLKIFGFPVKWVSVIESLDPGKWFVDIQEEGPYYYWHHKHSFIECQNGTLVHDEMFYASTRFSFVNFLVGGKVSKDLAAAFAYRRAKIADYFSAK